MGYHLQCPMSLVTVLVARCAASHEDAAELFASLTQFRRVRLGEGRLANLAKLYGGSGSPDVEPWNILGQRSHAKSTPLMRSYEIL